MAWSHEPVGGTMTAMSTEAIPAEEIRERIERVYVILERRDNPHGALAWFARTARVRPMTVSRWLSDGKERRPMSGTALSLLEALERLAAIEAQLRG